MSALLPDMIPEVSATVVAHCHPVPRRSSVSRAAEDIRSQTKATLDVAGLVGDVEGVKLRGESGVGLLSAVGSDEGVDLDGVDLVQLLDGVLNLSLVRLDVDDEDEGVVLLDLLLGGKGGKPQGIVSVGSVVGARVEGEQ